MFGKPLENNNSFVRQAAILGGASILVRLMGFITRILLTDLIGDEGNFLYGAGYSIYAFAIIVSSGALPAAVSKLVSERIALGQYRNAHELFRTAMLMAAVLGLGASAVLAFGADIIAVHFFVAPQAMYAIRTLAPTVFIVALLAVFRGYFQGMKNARPTALSQVVEQIFNAVATVWLAWLFLDEARIELSVAGATAGTGIGALAAVAVVGIMYVLAAPAIKRRAYGGAVEDGHEFIQGFASSQVQGQARDDEQISDFLQESENSIDESRGAKIFCNDTVDGNESRRVQIKKILATALPIIIGMSIFAIAGIVDMAMAQRRIAASGAFTLEEIGIIVGQFTGKFIVLTTFPVSLSLALSAAVIPEISTSSILNDITAIKNKINMSLRLSMAVSIPAAVGMAVLANPILVMLFPNNPEGGWMLQVGGISVIFMAMSQIITGVLQGAGKVSLPVIGAFFGVVIKIILNWVLMAQPAINIMGAVISTIVCYVVVTVFNIYFLKKHLGITPDFAAAIIKPTVAAAIMGASAWASFYFLSGVVTQALATLAAMGVGAMVYLVAMSLLRGFHPDDLAAMSLPGWVRKLLRR